MSIAIVNYGMGNLGSVRRALQRLGANVVIAERPQQLALAQRIILPGVGSFAGGMANLARWGWSDAICAEVQEGKPLLGICLGMQLLASHGTEGGETPGLGLIPGEVRRLDVLGCNLRLPHVGWNEVTLSGGMPGLLQGVPDRTDFYFVHSYAFVAASPDDVVARSVYGVPFAAAVTRRHVHGAQFHPEKSSRAGLHVLARFLEASPC